MPQLCVVAGCSNTSNPKEGISLHRFPKDPKIRRIWTSKVKLTRANWAGPCDTSIICSEHFPEDAFQVTLHGSLGLQPPNPKLKPGAIPVIKSNADQAKKKKSVRTAAEKRQRRREVDEICLNYEKKVKEELAKERGNKISDRSSKGEQSQQCSVQEEAGHCSEVIDVRPEGDQRRLHPATSMESMEHDGSEREDDEGSEDDAWIEDEGEEEMDREANASEIQTNEGKDSLLSSTGTNKESEDLEPGDKDKVFTAISFSVEDPTTNDSALSGKTSNSGGYTEGHQGELDSSIEEGEATSNDSSVVSAKTIKEKEGATGPEDAVPMDASENVASGMKGKGVDTETSKGFRALVDLQPEESSQDSQANPESPEEQMQGQGQSKPSSSTVCRTLSNSSASSSSSSSSQDETTDQGEESCLTCYRGFESVKEWRYHLYSHAIANLNRLPQCATCTLCQKVFPDHTNKPGPFKCKICTKLFPKKISSRNEHKVNKIQSTSHKQLGEIKGQVVFKCNLCLKGYTSMEGLMKHFSCDHKSFSCQICMKVVQNWESHMARFHEDAEFMENKLQIKDLLRSSGDPLLECMFCQNRFESYKSLGSHAREVHGEGVGSWIELAQPNTV